MISLIDDESLDKQWLDQLHAEWCKETANRAALLESLIIQRDWQACHRWIEQWATEASADELKAPSADSLPTNQNNR